MSGAQGEERAALRAALAAMPSLMDQVFTLYAQGLDYMQIADAIGISVAQVEQQIAAAALHLFLWLDGPEGTGEAL